ncbi:MAG: M14 family metallopeptidase [Actinomycetota bacterium]
MPVMKRLPTLVTSLVVLLGIASTAGASPVQPETGFEERGGADWTTHEEEVEFLEAVDRESDRIEIDEIGRTLGDRPLHLAQLGDPAPRTARQARTKPTALFVCSQHGNEPAGREACLQWLRDLAFTKDRALLTLLSRWTVLFVPAANPDGRAANTRGNSTGIDINRDHLNLLSNEAQAIGGVIRDWRPDIVVDLHEYGPGIPVLYDDDVLYLWPRNLNVDPQVYALSKSLAIDYIGKGAEQSGYTSDEYGLYAVGDQDVMQTAGDGDEGILRNAVGLRHGIGILVESRVDMRLSADEATSAPAVNLRRVASHKQAVADTLRFMEEQEAIVEVATEGAPLRKAKEGRRRSAPVYFGGADNDPPEPAQVQDPPPCGYRLSKAQVATLGPALRLHAIDVASAKGGVVVTMAQEAEPLIPLLLDERGIRSSTAGEPLTKC